jgi:hypothetical protein
MRSIHTVNGRAWVILCTLTIVLSGVVAVLWPGSAQAVPDDSASQQQSTGGSGAKDLVRKIIGKPDQVQGASSGKATKDQNRTAEAQVKEDREPFGDQTDRQDQQAKLVELDFRYALDEPVLLTEFRDEGIPIEPLRNKAFLLAPLHYEVTERRYAISAATRVETEEGKRCRVRGVSVTGEASRQDVRDLGKSYDQQSDSAALEQGFTRPQDSAPLYERIQPQIRNGEPILLWQNTTSPKPPRATGVRGVRDRSGGKGAYSGSPDRRRDDQRSVRRGEMPASGWAALLIEYPLEASELKVQFVSGATEDISLTLLQLVQATIDRSSQRDQDSGELTALARQIGSYTGDASPAMARLAVAWLARAGGQQRPADQDSGSIAEAIEQALLGALANDDAVAAQWAWTALSSRQQLSPVTLHTISHQAEPKLLGRLLMMIGQQLASSKQAADVGGSAARSRGATVWKGDTPGRAVESGGPIILPSSLPQSRAGAVCFAALQAVLQSRHVECVYQAVNLILEDGSKESVACLAEAPMAAKQAALQVLPTVGSGEVKTTAIKTMLMTPTPALLVSLVKAAGGIQISIVDPQDPLLDLPAKTTDRQSQLMILRLLQNANMEQVLNSTSFADMIQGLTGGLAPPEIRKAAYGLVIAQWLKAGGAVDQSDQRGFGKGGGGATGSHTARQLLINALLEPDRAVQRDAAAAMLKTGQVDTLAEQLNHNIDAEQAAGLLGELALDPQLRADDATLGLFAAMIGHNNPAVAQAALSAISLVAKDYRQQDRWRMRMAIKQQLSLEAIAQRAADSKPVVAKMAGEIAGILGAKPSADAQAIAQELQQTDEKMAENPSGKYKLLLATRLMLPEYELLGMPNNPKQKTLGQLQWRPVQAVETVEVTIAKGPAGQYVVSYEGKQIGTSAAAAAQAGGQDTSRFGKPAPHRPAETRTPKRGGRQGVNLRIDASGLVTVAAAKVASAPEQLRVPAPLAVSLHYLVLGAWEGTWQQASQQRDTPQYDQRFWVDARGKVILGRLPQPQVRQVSIWLEPVGTAPTTSGSSR